VRAKFGTGTNARDVESKYNKKGEIRPVRDGPPGERTKGDILDDWRHYKTAPRRSSMSSTLLGESWPLSGRQIGSGSRGQTGKGEHVFFCKLELCFAAILVLSFSCPGF
jgi:hypothetical protein